MHLLLWLHRKQFQSRWENLLALSIHPVPYPYTHTSPKKEKSKPN